MSDVVHGGFRFSDTGDWHFALRPDSGVPSGSVVSGGIARDSQGRAYVTFGDPTTGDVVHGGQRLTHDGAMYITDADFAAGDVVHGGMRRTTDGKLYITAGGAKSGDVVHGGIRRTTNGRVYVGGTALQEYVDSLSPVAWYQYGQGITSANSLVSAWADASGNGNDLEQATGANQPTLDSDNSILFDGVDNFLRAAFTLDQPCTFYALMNQVTSTSGDFLIGGAAAVARLFQTASSPNVALAAGATLGVENEPALGTWFAFAGALNGASSTTQINSGLVTTGDAGSNNPGGIVLAANQDGSGAWGNVAFKEVIAFSSAHDAATRARVIRYLAQVGAVAL